MWLRSTGRERSRTDGSTRSLTGKRRSMTPRIAGILIRYLPGSLGKPGHFASDRDCSPPINTGIPASLARPAGATRAHAPPRGPRAASETVPRPDGRISVVPGSGELLGLPLVLSVLSVDPALEGEQGHGAE